VDVVVDALVTAGPIHVEPVELGDCQISPN
jgi:hypothetical protein